MRLLHSSSLPATAGALRGKNAFLSFSVFPLFSVFSVTSVVNSSLFALLRRGHAVRGGQENAYQGHQAQLPPECRGFVHWVPVRQLGERENVEALLPSLAVALDHVYPILNETRSHGKRPGRTPMKPRPVVAAS